MPMADRLPRMRWLIGWLLLFLAGCTAAGGSNGNVTNPNTAAEQSEAAQKYEDLNIVTLLPPDAIPAIDDPKFLSAEEANQFYDGDELVIGVEFNGEARAYSIPLLSNHEIVNDTVGGVDIAVTW